MASRAIGIGSPPLLPGPGSGSCSEQAHADQGRQRRQTQQRRGDVGSRDAQVRNLEAPRYDEGHAEQEVAPRRQGRCRQRERLSPRPRSRSRKEQGPQGEKEKFRARQVVAPRHRLHGQKEEEKGERSPHAPCLPRSSDEQCRCRRDDRDGYRAPGPISRISASPPRADERRAVRGGEDRRTPSRDRFPFQRRAGERERPPELRRLHGKLSCARSRGLRRSRSRRGGGRPMSLSLRTSPPEHCPLPTVRSPPELPPTTPRRCRQGPSGPARSPAALRRALRARPRRARPASRRPRLPTALS